MSEKQVAEQSVDIDLAVAEEYSDNPEAFRETLTGVCKALSDKQLCIRDYFTVMAIATNGIINGVAPHAGISIDTLHRRFICMLMKAWEIDPMQFAIDHRRIGIEDEPAQ